MAILLKKKMEMCFFCNDTDGNNLHDKYFFRWPVGRTNCLLFILPSWCFEMEDLQYYWPFVDWIQKHRVPVLSDGVTLMSRHCNIWRYVSICSKTVTFQWCSGQADIRAVHCCYFHTTDTFKWGWWIVLLWNIFALTFQGKDSIHTLHRQ